MGRTGEVWRFIHQANIARYERILATYLTEHERHFVELRLVEEQAALQKLPPHKFSPVRPKRIETNENRPTHGGGVKN